MNKLFSLAFMVLLAIGGRAEAVNVITNGDFSVDGDATGWTDLDDIGTWSVSGGVCTLSSGGADTAVACYQVVSVTAGVEATLSCDWMGSLGSNVWWTEVMLFTFEDPFADDTVIVDGRSKLEVGYSSPWAIPTLPGRLPPHDPYYSAGNDGDGGIAFKKDAWGQNQATGDPTWSWESGADSPAWPEAENWPTSPGFPAGKDSVVSMGQIVVLLKLGGPGVGSAGFISFDNVELDVPLQSLLIGDANMDGTVDAADTARLATYWLKTGEAVWAQGDFNDDGNVDDVDATLLAANWGRSSNNTAVPEPSTLAMLLAALGMAFFVILRQFGLTMSFEGRFQEPENS